MSGGFLIFKKFFWILFFQFFIFKFWKIFKKYFWILKSALFIFCFFNSIHFAENKLLRGQFYGQVRLKRSIINRTCLTIFNAKLHPFFVFFSIGNLHEKIWRQNLGSQNLTVGFVKIQFLFLTCTKSCIWKTAISNDRILKWYNYRWSLNVIYAEHDLHVFNWVDPKFEFHIEFPK